MASLGRMLYSLPTLCAVNSGQVNKKNWRCRGSNPVPLACKASALPFELHPQLNFCCLGSFDGD